MYYFAQFKADKKCTWELKEEGMDLERRPVFRTVLSLSADPSSYDDHGVEPEDKVKYLGPMYFDLDGDDIDAVIKDSREIIHRMVSEFHIPEEAIHIFLSGKKGLHITVDERVFGITRPTLLLPHIWKKFAEKFSSEFIDRVVYSLGKGRMWRCCNIKRPDTGTYKVEISRDELNHLDAGRYTQLVSSERPQISHPTGRIKPVPALASFTKAASSIVKDELKNRRKFLDNITSEDLRAVEGVPGCIRKLITDGDCPSSNWNQAAMQLAGYIGARYHAQEEDEFKQDLMEPFLDNVTTRSRPNRSDRASTLGYLLRRAFSGGLKFSARGVMKTIGGSCGDCVICSKKEVLAQARDGESYDPATGIKVSRDGVFLVGEQSMKQLLTSSMLQSVSYVSFDNEFNQEMFESGEYVFSGGSVANRVRVVLDESSFADKRRFQLSIAGTGSVFEGSDGDLAKLHRFLIGRRDEAERMIRTYHSGIQMREVDGEVYPNLVTRNDSYCKGGGASEYVYCGPPHLAPDFHTVRDFETEEDVEAMVVALESLLGMNEVQVIVPGVGWAVACHLKEHINFRDKNFPMLNLYGSSHSGKSATAFLLAAINGFPYRKCIAWNAESSTAYPLEEMVSTTTTFIRIVEEANEHNAKKNWSKLQGILKASWDELGIDKGALKGKSVVSEKKPNPAPIMYLSEQSSAVQAIRTRSVECMLKSISREHPVYVARHQAAVEGVKSLEMLAKVLVTMALNTSISQVEDWRDEFRPKLPEKYSGRTVGTYLAVFVGLRFLSYTLGAYSERLSKKIETLSEEYMDYLHSTSDELSASKKISALDDFLVSVDQMAGESDNLQHGIRSGAHYWKDSASIYLDMRSIFPRYRRYLKGVGQEASLRNPLQILSLLKGESYYVGEISAPDKPAIKLVQLDLKKLSERGIQFSYTDEEPLS